jgi:hypothetical protein
MRTACACGFGSDASEQEVPLEQLSDIKAKSIVEWIANDRVRRSIVKNFRQFLMTYVDDHGASVYGQRIRALGESASIPHFQEMVSLARYHARRQLRVARGLIPPPRAIQTHPCLLSYQLPGCYTHHL